MNLVENIRALCSSRNTTLIGLEREIGLGRGTLRNWDTYSPSIDKVQKVANYFHVPIGYLVGESSSTKNLHAEYELRRLIETAQSQIKALESTLVDIKNFEF